MEIKKQRMESLVQRRCSGIPFERRREKKSEIAFFENARMAESKNYKELLAYHSEKRDSFGSVFAVSFHFGEKSSYGLFTFYHTFRV